MIRRRKFACFGVLSRRTCVLSLPCFIVLGWLWVNHGQSETGEASKRSLMSWNSILSNPNYRKSLLPNKGKQSSLSDLSFLPEHLRKSRVLKRDEKHWLVDDSVSTDGNFPFAKLKSPSGDLGIYIYPVKDDTWVSGSIEKEGMWEGDLVTIIHDILKEDPTLDFVDIGANLGVYTLSMARLGRRVVAVEPFIPNLQRLCKSVRMGNLSSSVFIVHNALSDARKKITFGKFTGNVGGTYVVNTTGGEQDTAQAIILDDLLEIFALKKIVMKMDVEKHEVKVLAGAEQFFSKVDVRFLLLEMSKDIRAETGETVVRFLTRHNMKAHVPRNLTVPLDINRLSEWPSDIMWKKEI